MVSQTPHALVIQDIRQLLSAAPSPQTLPPELIVLYLQLQPDVVP